MFRTTKIILISGLMATCGFSSLVWAEAETDEQVTATYYEKMLQQEPIQRARLNLFMNKLPKGGDLHHHYTGSIYAETYLDWIKEKGWFINTETLRIEKEKTDDNVDVPHLMKDGLLVARVLGTWSIKDFYNHESNKIPPTNQFFRTFRYFSPISDADFEAGLNILKTRAKFENMIYLETMLERVGIKTKYLMTKPKRKAYDQAIYKAANNQELDKVLDGLLAFYVGHNIYKEKLAHYLERISSYQKMIDDEDFTLRFQTYGVRVLSPSQVFLDLLSGYQAAEQSPYVVGVNIVAPEQNQVSLDDYTLHMQMFNYLSRKMPGVNRALHAGELVVGLVRPKDMKFHIAEAIDIAGAQRIGHGVDIAHENNPLKLLKKMQKVPVEISLTSNEFILGVEPEDHPYDLYKEHKVPMVIVTDDSGVSRNDLSTEYSLLAERYKPDYAEIKHLVFNSIKYSFASDEDKRRLRTKLTQQFSQFEAEMAGFIREL